MFTPEQEHKIVMVWRSISRERVKYRHAAMNWIPGQQCLSKPLQRSQTVTQQALMGQHWFLGRHSRAQRHWGPRGQATPPSEEMAWVVAGPSEGRQLGAPSDGGPVALHHGSRLYQMNMKNTEYIQFSDH